MNFYKTTLSTVDTFWTSSARIIRTGPPAIPKQSNKKVFHSERSFLELCDKFVVFRDHTGISRDTFRSLNVKHKP